MNNQSSDTPENQMKQPADVISDFGRHDHESPSHLGLIIGILVVLLVLIGGGFYLWSSNFFNQIGKGPDVSGTYNKLANTNNNQSGADGGDNLSDLSTSDEIDFILDDLNNKVDIDSVEDELNQIESELFNLWLRENSQEPSSPPPPTSPSPN